MVLLINFSTLMDSANHKTTKNVVINKAVKNLLIKLIVGDKLSNKASLLTNLVKDLLPSTFSTPKKASTLSTSVLIFVSALAKN